MISSAETGNFLRSGELHLPENFGESLQLRQEADFYQIVLSTATILLAEGQLRPVERHLALLCLTRMNLLHPLHCGLNCALGGSLGIDIASFPLHCSL